MQNVPYRMKRVERNESERHENEWANSKVSFHEVETIPFSYIQSSLVNVLTILVSNCTWVQGEDASVVAAMVAVYFLSSYFCVFYCGGGIEKFPEVFLALNQSRVRIHSRFRFIIPPPREPHIFQPGRLPMVRGKEPKTDFKVDRFWRRSA